jgi:hypothetical protein
MKSFVLYSLHTDLILLGRLLGGDKICRSYCVKCRLSEDEVWLGRGHVGELCIEGSIILKFILKQ